MTTLMHAAGHQQKQPVPPTPISTENLHEILSQAVDFHRAGLWREAETRYRKVLEIDPAQANANHNLGILALDADQVNESLDYFKTALANDPDEPQFWISYVDALIRANLMGLATQVLMDGLERGLHGDEVNALVDQLTRRHQIQDATNVVEFSESAPNTQIAALAHVEENMMPVINVIESDSPLPSCPEFRSDVRIQQAFEWLQAGRLKEAKGRYIKLLRIFPKHPHVLAGLGVIAVQQGEMSQGVRLLEESLSIDPNQSTAWSGLGIAYTAMARYEQAIASCSKAIALNPDYAEAYVNRANAYKADTCYEQAIADYAYAATLRPEDANLYFNLGLTYRQTRQYQSAVLCFNRTIALNPNDAEAEENCVDMLIELELYPEALQRIHHAITLTPPKPENYYRRGLIYLMLENFQAALADFEYVIERAPNHCSAYLNIGVVLRRLNRNPEALAAIESAIKLDSKNAIAYNNRGLIYVDAHRLEEAEADYMRAIALDPAYDITYWNKSVMHLLRGDFAEGWLLYEWRWKTILKEAKRTFVQPLWLGEPAIVGKTLLVYPEQGLGDYIQFCRYIPLLEAAGVRVILETPRALGALMACLSDKVIVIEEGSILPTFDYQCPIMSLPRAFGTTLETVPAPTTYLRADDARVATWQKKLAAKKKPRIGLVWSGSLAHKNDHNRSLTLDMLAPILSLDAAFHVLQKEIRTPDKALLEAYPALHTHVDDLHDFSDTAALIANMDLVISVDTSVAHLAGAMGKPCWVLLPYAPDFRWMLDGQHSPWYPTITLFRQDCDGDWRSVVAKIDVALKANVLTDASVL